MDKLSSDARSRNMARIRSRDTRPEREVRSLLHRLGYRFRLVQHSLPGTPDIVLPKYHTAIFVHGCFWHRHAYCQYAYMPKTRTRFWKQKFRANRARDRKVIEQLKAIGWHVLVVWECELGDPAILSARLNAAIKHNHNSANVDNVK